MTSRPAPVGADGQTPELPERVFATGACGFVGRAVLARYRELGVEVRGMDVRADPEWDVVAGDIGEAGSWQEHAAGCELVVHTAAVVSNVAPPELYRRVSSDDPVRRMPPAYQGHAMEVCPEPPLRAITTGRCYRRDKFGHVYSRGHVIGG